MKIDTKLWNDLMAFKMSENEMGVNCSLCAYSYLHGFSFISKTEINDDTEYLLSSNNLKIKGWNEDVILDGALFIYYKSNGLTSIVEALKYYASIVFMSKQRDRTLPFVMIHMAQSLDGKICTDNGSSKWIGNDENLIHAHRLRACVDGILVGGNTLATDLPKLDVRHVDGPNPTRLFLSNKFVDFDKLPKVAGSRTFLLRKLDKEEATKDITSVDKTILFGACEKSEPLYDLLVKLKINGMNSILIEGGTKTVSSFWKSGFIDWAQIHIAPIILGGGKSFVQIAGVEKVSDGAVLTNVFYTKMGDAIMITGECVHHPVSKAESKSIYESESTLA